ncbi:MAG: hypothetical protein VST70_01680 [Nitrospirota bacterium]|nr:hypothetical protein [Nitrospirota bacterium]
MREFKVGDHDYRTVPFDVFLQIKVGLKVSTALTKAIQKTEGDGLPLQDILDILAGTPGEDIDFVVQSCLGCVQRREGSAWATIYNREAKRIAYADILPIDVLTLTAQVLEEYLLPFYEGLVRLASVPAKTTPGS